MYRRGPRTDPWGRPLGAGTQEDLDSPWTTHMERSLRKEASHERRVPETPKDKCRRCNKISWYYYYYYTYIHTYIGTRWLIGILGKLLNRYCICSLIINNYTPCLKINCTNFVSKFRQMSINFNNFW